jgi:hypothetical protein
LSNVNPAAAKKKEAANQSKKIVKRMGVSELDFY